MPDNIDTMKFEAELKNLPLMLESLRDYAKKQGFGDEKINKIQLAVEEILANIINYAYPDKNGSIEINCDNKEGKGLGIEIIDWGIPFDPLTVAETDTKSSVEDRNVGGLGIFLVRKIMDEIQYRREDDKNILTLTIYQK